MPSSLWEGLPVRVLHELRREIISFVFDFKFVWTCSISQWVYLITNLFLQSCCKYYHQNEPNVCRVMQISNICCNRVDSRHFSNFKLSFWLLREAYDKHINSTCVWLQPLLNVCFICAFYPRECNCIYFLYLVWNCNAWHSL